MPELVTIAVYVDPIRAQFARMLLEREDIPCFLLGEHLTNQGRAAYAPEGGVSVQVAVENVVALRALEHEREAEVAPADVVGETPYSWANAATCLARSELLRGR